MATLHYAVADPVMAYGLDLDMQRGGPVGTCSDQIDYTSAVTGELGVDNQLGAFLPSFDGLIDVEGWDGAVANAIEGGRFGIVLEVTDVPADPCARRVHVWAAELESGAAPELRAACGAATGQSDCEAMLGGSCRYSPATDSCRGIAPEQRWRARDDLGALDGTLVGGRLRTTALPRLSLIPVLPAPTGAAPLAMHDVIFEADLYDDGLTRGELGGAIEFTEMLGWVNTNLLARLPVDAVALASVFPPDLTPSSDGLTCADYSAGFGFTAIAATLVH